MSGMMDRLREIVLYVAFSSGLLAFAFIAAFVYGIVYDVRTIDVVAAGVAALFTGAVTVVLVRHALRRPG